MAFLFCAALNGRGWARTHSAVNWLSVHNLHQGFVSSFAGCPNSEMFATVMVAKENSGCVLCVCIHVCPPQTLNFSKPGSFRSYSLEERMWHLCWLDLMKWQIIGAVPCVGSSLSPILCIVPILHDLFADGSSIKALFLKKLFAGRTIQNTECSSPLGSA